MKRAPASHPWTAPRLLAAATAAGVGLALALAAVAPACKQAPARGPGADAGVSAARTAPRVVKDKPNKDLKGAVLLNDKWIPVAPFVGHDAHMDLYVQCKEARDRAQAAGKTAPPLCYEDVRVNEPKRLRIEHAEGRRGGDAMRALRQADGGAHFLIERNGSIRQILDLAYPPRRAGATQRGELRVLSGNRAAHEALAASLVKAFPGLQVEVVEVPVAPARPPAPKPAAAKAPGNTPAPPAGAVPTAAPAAKAPSPKAPAAKAPSTPKEPHP